MRENLHTLIKYENERTHKSHTPSHTKATTHINTYLVPGTAQQHPHKTSHTPTPPPRHTQLPTHRETPSPRGEPSTHSGPSQIQISIRAHTTYRIAAVSATAAFSNRTTAANASRNQQHNSEYYSNTTTPEQQQYNSIQQHNTSCTAVLLTTLCPWPSLAGWRPSARETREPPGTAGEARRTARALSRRRPHLRPTHYGRSKKPDE